MPMIDPKVLSQEFPQWRIWRARQDDGTPGSWVATYKGPQAQAVHATTLCIAPTVCADDPDQLATRLREEIQHPTGVQLPAGEAAS